jgi:Flp pilus assembly protein TadG
MSRRIALPMRARGRGQSLVEFALVFPIIMLLVFGFIDVGRAVFFANTLSNAARQSARVAAVNQLDPVAGPWECDTTRPIEDPADPHWTYRGCAVAAGASIGVLPNDVTRQPYTAPPGTTLECTSAVNVGCLVTVTVTHQFQPITPLAGIVIGTLSLSGTSSVPIERVFP